MLVGRRQNQIVRRCGWGIQHQGTHFRIAPRGIQRGVSAQVDSVNADRAGELRLARSGFQRMQIIDRGGRVVAFHAAEERPVNRRILAVSAQVG